MNRKGFTLLEVLSVLSIVVILGTAVLWNFRDANTSGKAYLAEQRARLIDLAKESFWEKNGYNETFEASANEAKFAQLRPYLPYGAEGKNLEEYTPQGFIFAIGGLDEKTRILRKN